MSRQGEMMMHYGLVRPDVAAGRCAEKEAYDCFNTYSRLYAPGPKFFSLKSTFPVSDEIMNPLLRGLQGPPGIAGVKIVNVDLAASEPVTKAYIDEIMAMTGKISIVPPFEDVDLT